ncbi:protein XNDC1N isoform X2 [Columba livia]|nr:hypothetical protein Q9966_011572 [Columba livia]
MAPVKISYVVSFSSQDPKFPVENLLREDEPRPWLCCPRDRSQRLHVELQLERASPIGYVDIGNCGCAFLQIEVGRSSWPCDRPFLTLLPSVVLMTPAQSKLGQNRCGVRMFKEADFLAPALGQKWDRLRLIGSQPFSKHGRFGLSFIRVRTPLDPPHPPPPPQHPPPPEDTDPVDTPWRSSPAFRRTFDPEPHSSCGEEQQLRSRLQQLEPAARSPVCLSRPAQMVLSAARSRARRPRNSTGAPGGHRELPAGDLGGPAVPGSVQDDVPAAPRAHGQPEHRQRAHEPASRSPLAGSTSGGKARTCSPRERRAGWGDRGGDSGPGDTGICPLCSGHFSLELLPTHAAGCGEEEPEVAQPSSPPGGSWVSCPLCQLLFAAAEVEQHASTCGEGTPGTYWLG